MNSLLNALIVLSADFLALTVGWYLTVWIRVFLDAFFPKQLTYSIAISVAPPLSLLLVLWFLSESWQWYRAKRSCLSVPRSLSHLFERALLADALLTVAIVFSREFGISLSRSLVLLFVPVSFVALFVSRQISGFLVSGLRRFWAPVERIGIVGSGEEARRLSMMLQDAGRPGRLTGFILSDRSTEFLLSPGDKLFGYLDSLAQVINREHVDCLIIADSALPETRLESSIEICHRMGVPLSRTVAAPLTQVEARLSDRYGSSLLELHPIQVSLWQSAAKRVLDTTIALCLLILLAPLLLLVALAIKITSPGPVIYKSKRVGRGGRHFTFLKFRSMIDSADQVRKELEQNAMSGHIFKMRSDPRVTSIGRLIRRTSIDELPQLLNVLAGEMSLVGPRPLPANDLDPDGMSKEFRTWAERRATVLPGITGLWQISGRSELSFEQMAQLDIDYVHRWSLVSDFRILLTTPLALFTGRGAF